MKKFKLIKKFPKSPEIGTVVLKGGNRGHYIGLYADEKNIFFFKAEDIENYPEFWEEMYIFNNVPWRLVSYKYDDSGTYVSGIPLLHESVRFKNMKFITIQRLTDNKIFTVGEKYDEGIIEDFYILNKEILVAKINNKEVGIDLLTAKEEENFKTFDGFEIKEGSTIYAVDTHKLKFIKFDILIPKLFDFYKIFAEKENAIKYIKDKEKKYSLNDIKETVNKLGCFGTTLIEYLENEKSEK